MSNYAYTHAHYFEGHKNGNIKMRAYETDLLGGEGLRKESFENELVAQGSMRYRGEDEAEVIGVFSAHLFSKF